MRYLRVGIIVALLCTDWSICNAEVIDLEGTVKAVDATARTITIERKTPKGTKTLELEIARNLGDAVDLKTGSTVSFSYDPDLEIVTRIESSAGSSGKHDSATQKTTDRYIASLSISRDGEATLITGPSPGPTAFTAKQQGIARTRSPDGTWDSVYVFDGPRVIDAFAFARGVTFEPDASMIRLSRDAKRNQAVFVARELLAPPCLIEWEGPVTVSPAKIRVRLSSLTGNAVGMAAVNILGIQKGSRAEIKATVTQARPTDRKSPSSVDIFKEDISLTEQMRHHFKFPESINLNAEPLGVFILGAVDDDNAALTKLRIKGHVSFNWGIRWDSLNGGAYVKDVVTKSIAERVGIKAGDLIISIGDCRPDSVDTAQRCLADVTFDEEVTVRVKRGDSTEMFTVMESWDRDR